MCLGIPGRIVAIVDAERMLATADIAGVRRDINVACVAEGPLDDLPGRWVLIHVGFAMALIDEDEAARTLEALRALGETEELAGAISGQAGAAPGGTAR
ncbi:MAG: HypC/HybG/HupF family hydrogenase formation chaperone [Rhodobacteraceae bacterium]|nr:HypC/HybG/HupF family hydrogenase formation chaperone [Paracoccaceae bacterium]